MKKKLTAFLLYMVIIFAFAFYFGNKLYTYTDNVYTKQIEKYKYQLNYNDTYSAVYSPNINAVLETATSGENQPEKAVEKTIYLTFDDGPSPRTEEILDILKKHDVKATFFVVKDEENYTEFLKRASEEGHSIGIHSASHRYNIIYRDVDSFLKDFTECYDYIVENTGVTPTISRFPGGSVNTYNSAICRELIEEVTRRGFQYFDWNVDSGDGTGKLSSSQIYNNVVGGCKGRKRAVIIMHDAPNKKSTVEALDNIITTLKNDGWQFAPLDNRVKPMVFRLK